MADQKIHQAIPDLLEDFRKGKISRREFFRYATLLGASLATARYLTAFAPGPAYAQTPAPTGAAAVAPKRGGTLRVAAQVHKLTHPAQISWVSPSNQLRQVAEYLTLTDRENITHPYLLEKWEASPDVKTWTLYLRKGIKFSNGDEFTADDVVFTMKEWLNKDVGSSMLGLMGDYLKPSGIEKVDPYTLKLHLDRGEIGVPEHLFHFPALILNHKTFEGDFLKAPHGTGPYTLEQYKEAGRVLVKRRNDYWQTGADGKSLPYMDAMEFIDMGGEVSPQVAALKSGEIDMIDLGDSAGGSSFYVALKDDLQVNALGTLTCGTSVLRMRVDQDPWTDNNVRSALKLCQNREKILKLAYFNQGVTATDSHVYPRHPEYCEQPIPKYDPEKAKQLLTDAGYGKGLDVNLAVGSDWPDVVSFAEILKEDAAPAGFRININPMPSSQYWDKWMDVDLGITPWTHRPLGTMILSLAYTKDANGKPSSWNETRWIDDEFSTLLTQANGTLDVEARRKLFCKLEAIQVERGSVGIPFWRNSWMVARNDVKNMEGHPTQYMLFNEVWLDKVAKS